MPRAIARTSPPRIRAGGCESSIRRALSLHMTRTLLVVLAACCLVSLTPRPAGADLTAFLGTTTTPTNRAVKGIAGGISLVIVGFEFEYASTSEDPASDAPSLKTTSGNVYAQTIGLPVQLYITTGTGLYRERLRTAQETSVVFNTGGGVKIPLAGPLRARIDYRIFNLRGSPLHPTVQRLYAGLNLAF